MREIHPVERRVERARLRSGRERAERRPFVGHERLERGALGSGQRGRAGEELGPDGRAEVDRAHEPRRREERLHGVRRDDDRAEVAEQLEARRGGLQRGQDAVRAVLGQVVVVEPGRAELPQMPDEEVDLALRQLEIVLPQVARLVIRVLAHLVEVGVVIPAPLEEPAEALHRIEHRVTGVRHRGEVDAVVHQLEAAPALGRGALVHAQESMTEGRGGVVQVVGGEDERDRARLEPLPEDVPPLASPVRQHGRVEIELAREPGEARRELALRVLELGIGGLRREEAGQRRVQLGGGIGLPDRGEEEGGPIGVALHPAQPLRAVVEEPPPAEALGEPPGARPREESGLQRQRSAVAGRCRRDGWAVPPGGRCCQEHGRREAGDQERATGPRRARSRRGESWRWG